MRELDTNIYKIVDSYRLLLRKGQVNATGTVGAHEELQVEAASASIVRAESSPLRCSSTDCSSVYFLYVGVSHSGHTRSDPRATDTAVAADCRQ